MRDSKAQTKEASTANSALPKAKPATLRRPLTETEKAQTATVAKRMKSSRLKPVDLPGDAVTRFVEAALENT